VSGVSEGERRAGTNVKGNAAGAAWTYLLDSLEVGRLLYIGRPSPASRRTLERVAGELVVADRPSDTAPGRFDVVCIARPQRSNLVGGLLGEIAPRLEVGGMAYVEGPGRAVLERAVDRSGLAVASAFRMTPATGEMETAVPLDDPTIGGWFRRHRITARRGRRPLARLVHRFVPGDDATRFGLLATTAADARTDETQVVPAYIRAAARTAGIDLTAHRVGLAARGRYGSRKVIAYLFAPGGAKPELVVKITREPGHNDRLLNEERALREVARRTLVDPGAAPEVLFSAEHGGLRLVGESAIEGTLLTESRSAHAVADAYRWLIELSVRSAQHRSDMAGRRAAWIERIVSDIGRTYQPPTSTTQRLSDVAGRLIEEIDALPIVFAHGDAAAWNVLVQPNDRVAFLDWEAADAEGMPLWDVFHFARSHVIARARVGRLARRPSALLRSIVEDEGLRSTVAAYTARLGIDPALVAPLMTLCWAHRALREVTRLEAPLLNASHYLGLMNASLDARAQATWPRSSSK
jgi:hypothetical protein